MRVEILPLGIRNESEFYSMNKILGTFGVIVGIAIIIGIVIVFPFLTIWAVNTLFSLTIPYTLETWVAVILLQIFFKTSFSYKKDK